VIPAELLMTPRHPSDRKGPGVRRCPHPTAPGPFLCAVAFALL